MKTGVVLLNMGGPEKLEDVRPFLFNLFSDRDIIKLGPPFLQKIIAWQIARKRAPKSRNLYKQIGGGSPLTKITLAQAEALQEALSSHGDYFVTAAMRYWQPTSATAIKELEEQKVDRIITLSLYPHYSRATSGSSIKDFQKVLAGSSLKHLSQTYKPIKEWPDHPGYINCLAELINDGLTGFQTDQVELVYSAHSLPTSFIDEGDPYVDHIKRTITAIEKITGKKGHLCYQSRSGPVEWLSPSTSDTIKKLSKQGCKDMLVLPISFVSDHVETLYEINIMFKEEAKELGAELKMTAGLNTHPDFIACLKNLVLSEAS